MTDFTKGQQATIAQDTSGVRAAGWGPSVRLNQGTRVTITAVRRQTITVKYRDYSYNVDREMISAPNGEVWTAPPPKPPVRKIGVMPEGGIAADDPRLAWLWEDAAKLANRSGYCSVFDRLADELGIPGRERDIQVDTKVNGLNIRATVKARSTKEAEAKVLAQLAPSA